MDESYNSPYEELDKWLKMEDRWLSISGDLQITSGSVMTIAYKWIDKHEMPAHRMGRPLGSSSEGLEGGQMGKGRWRRPL